MSMMPQKDTSAVLTQLIRIGFINHIQVEQVKGLKQAGTAINSTSSTSGSHGQHQLMYGFNHGKTKAEVTKKVS